MMGLDYILISTSALNQSIYVVCLESNCNIPELLARFSMTFVCTVKSALPYAHTDCIFLLNQKGRKAK